MYNGLNGFIPYYRPSIGLLGTLKKFSWGGFLTGTQKTLNVVNQAIPLVYQVKPMINNAKTIFKVIGAVKDDKVNTNKNVNTNTNTNTYSNSNESNDNSYNPNQPNFFL